MTLVLSNEIKKDSFLNNPTFSSSHFQKHHLQGDPSTLSMSTPCDIRWNTGWFMTGSSWLLPYISLGGISAPRWSKQLICGISGHCSSILKSHPNLLFVVFKAMNFPKGPTSNPILKEQQLILINHWTNCRDDPSTKQHLWQPPTQPCSLHHYFEANVGLGRFLQMGFENGRHLTGWCWTLTLGLHLLVI